jgi:hypothetical protein
VTIDLDAIIAKTLHADPGNGYLEVARAVAAHALRWAAEEYQNTQPTMPGTVPGFSAFLRIEADALAHRQEPAQFTDSTGRKVLMPLDGSKVVGTVEPNDATEAGKEAQP